MMAKRIYKITPLGNNVWEFCPLDMPYRPTLWQRVCLWFAGIPWREMW